MQTRGVNFLKNEFLEKVDFGFEKNSTTPKKVLLVTHGGFIMELTNFVEKQIDPNFEEKVYGMPNTCVSIFEISKNAENGENEYQILVKADSSHLE